MKRGYLIVMLPAGLMLAVLSVGFLLPQSHLVERTSSYPVPPEQLWSVITDFEHQPDWMPSLTSKKRLPDRDGHAVWQETRADGDETTYEIVESDPPRRLVTEIVDAHHFGGTWIYQLRPTARGTELTITEQGEIYNPVLRVLTRVAIGFYGRLDAYMSALRHKVG